MLRKLWKVFRAVVSALLLMAVVLPATLYVLLSIDPVQNGIRRVASDEISKTLGADVAIGRVVIHPFNRLAINDVSLSVGTDTIARLSTVSAGFELMHFLRTGELVIDYALIDGADVHISRATPSSPLNIQSIIEHLRSDEPREEKAFELQINTVVLRNGSIAYDVLSAAAPDSARFDPSHIAVEKLEVNAFIPQISNRRYSVHLDHLSFVERSGFRLDALQAKAEFGTDGARLYDFSLDLPQTHLAFEPMELEFNGYSDIKAALRRNSVQVVTRGLNTVYLPDAGAFVPALAMVDTPLVIDIDAEGSLTQARLRSLGVHDAGGIFSLLITGEAHNIDSRDDFAYELSRAGLYFDGEEAVRLFGKHIKPSVAAVVKKIPDFRCTATGSGTLQRGSMHMLAGGTPGSLEFDGSYRRMAAGTGFSGKLTADGFDLGLLTGKHELGLLSAEVTGSGVAGRRPSADVDIAVSSIGFRGYDYRNITVELDLENKHKFELDLAVNDPNAKLLVYALYDGNDGVHSLLATATAAGVDFNALGLDSGHEDYHFGAKVNLAANGTNADDLDLSAGVFDVKWLDRRGNGMRIAGLNIESNPDVDHGLLTIDSDVLTGRIRGRYAFTSIASQLRDICAVFVPAVFPAPEPEPKHRRHTRRKPEPPAKPNDFDFEFTLKPSQNITQFLNLPLHVLYDVDISGRVDSRNGRANVNINAPYLRQGDKLIENTDIFAALDTAAQSSTIYASTQFPTKKGDMAVSALIRGADNRLDTHIDWTMERAIPLNGTIDFSTLLRAKPGKQPEGIFPLDACINFNPGTLNFGDEVWSILTSEIDISPRRITVDGFGLDAGSQKIAINGAVSNLDTDSLSIALDKVSLLPIFETLEIDKALIGGKATGVFTAKTLTGAEPSLVCPHLHVDSIGYNRCTIGNAEIAAGWDNAGRSFNLDADITGLEGRKSHIYGDIFPFTEALDITFEADSVPVGFLKPFMSAFTSSISGRASGKCRLFGTFKEIDLEGDVFADNVTLKVDFTNTSYTATDSVHMSPGLIALNDVTVRDREGNTALLNGIVQHTYFKEPVFRFDVTKAHNLLSYNVSSRENPDWYGTIYGNGGASISGYPGVVNINVAMSTGPRSTFTFVLSDRLDAEDYSFLTFRDVTPDSLRADKLKPDDTPEAVRAFRRQVAAMEDAPSQYNMDIRVDVTKDAAMTLVMDPAGGDEIKARGEGNLHLAYNSTNNDLNIWGKYTVANGSYRFTLQDIIIKDFTIKEGSEIQFDGDPYGVKTNLEAYYATNANLSDLDESFLQDKEVARTNVPVHALMKVSGDIRQPSIDFDLEFPTLTSDTYRKVRSIVSTPDMMNRQIIYLLALNRFYTPDYMASTTKGNELFSVASSTLTSQLGNMLGKLSDNLSIAPNLRSDRGDFSDVEVDVALSSRLLNNRLIFNGNFGYRDKALNSNQFIGDFDIEYLLNKRGSWRLKAYNRYNDRNYYLRSAQTTQGLGIMFRRDFDSFLSFLKGLKKKK